MSKVVDMFYFSGTGNTALVAELFKKEFELHLWQISMNAIDKEFVENFATSLTDSELIGLGFTIHAFNAPQIVFNFIEKLPYGNDKKTFLFKCPGDPLMKAGSTHLVRDALKKRGYTVFHESLIVGSANIAIPYDERLVRQLYLAAKEKVRFRVNEIINGTARLQKNGLLLKIFTFLFSTGESKIGAPVFGKLMKTGATCTKCQKCINVCPKDNITFSNNTIHFGSQCSFCMRCIYSCPTDAIVPVFGNFVKVKNWRSFENIGTDESVNTTFITSATRGYFKHFLSYFNEP